jgi:mono/diheme cytochrome c family protein
MTAHPRRAVRGLILVVVVLIAASAIGYWYLAVRSVPVTYADPADRFKYGSLGTEVDALPFYVWQALPAVCPAKLPGGYASLGFIYEDGWDRPIGISLRTVGVLRMGVNCAGCHVGSVRTAPHAPPRVLIGAPNEQLDFQGYIEFLLSCIQSDAFTPEAVIAAVDQQHPLSAIESFVYRHFIVPSVRSQATVTATQFEWYKGRPRFGPGRLDTPNSLKRLIGLPIPQDSVGTVEFPSVWNQRARLGKYEHWNANNPSLQERDHITAVIAGATTRSIDSAELAWVEAWLKDLPPPKYPLPIDESLAARGAIVYEDVCSSCHTRQFNEVTPIDRVMTDPARVRATSSDLIERLNAFGTGVTGQRAHYRMTDGYSNVLLDGVWARAPYLHNGAVPTMRELLEPAEKRSRLFRRGSNVYDAPNMGFVSSGPTVERAGLFEFDTSIPGNGNGGHLYGVNLPDADKAALIEYLKKQ